MRGKKANGGYALQPRAIFEHEIYQMPLHYRVIWHYLWGMANHADRNSVRRGQIFTTLQELAEVCSYTVGYRKQGISRRDSWRVCEWLRERTMITTAKTTRGIIITISNFEFWQNPKNYERDNERRTNATTNGARSECEREHYTQECKNEKNERREETDSPPPKKQAAKRKPKPIFDAVCEIFGLKPTTKGDGKRIGKLERDFKFKGASPDEIKRRLENYRRLWPEMADTPEALIKHWDRMDDPPGSHIPGDGTSPAEIAVGEDARILEAEREVIRLERLAKT